MNVMICTICPTISVFPAKRAVFSAQTAPTAMTAIGATIWRDSSASLVPPIVMSVVTANLKRESIPFSANIVSMAIWSIKTLSVFLVPTKSPTASIVWTCTVCSAMETMILTMVLALSQALTQSPSQILLQSQSRSQRSVLVVPTLPPLF